MTFRAAGILKPFTAFRANSIIGKSVKNLVTF
jgi:hypothetical protein